MHRWTVPPDDHQSRRQVPEWDALAARLEPIGDGPWTGAIAGLRGWRAGRYPRSPLCINKSGGSWTRTSMPISTSSWCAARPRCSGSRTRSPATPMAAENLVQRALAKAFVRWRRIRGEAEPYVNRIIYRGSASRWRRRSNRVEAVMLRAALLGLPSRHRAVLVLRYLEHRSVEETAEILGRRPGTVASQATQAVATLRELIPDDARTTDRVDTLLRAGDPRPRRRGRPRPPGGTGPAPVRARHDRPRLPAPQPPPRRLCRCGRVGHRLRLRHSVRTRLPSHGHRLVAAGRALPARRCRDRRGHRRT